MSGSSGGFVKFPPPPPLFFLIIVPVGPVELGSAGVSTNIFSSSLLGLLEAIGDNDLNEPQIIIRRPTMGQNEACKGLKIRANYGVK
jgi:hypothetical protein